jgi:hypothetical protein
MARLRRLVIPGIPYHVTQRGNRRQQSFFEEADYALYRDLPGDAARRAHRGSRPSPLPMSAMGRKRTLSGFGKPHPISL